MRVSLTGAFLSAEDFIVDSLLSEASIVCSIVSAFMKVSFSLFTGVVNEGPVC